MQRLYAVTDEQICSSPPQDRVKAAGQAPVQALQLAGAPGRAGLAHRGYRIFLGDCTGRGSWL